MSASIDKPSKQIITSMEDYSLNEPEIEDMPGAYHLRDLVAHADPDPPQVEIDPREDLAALVFTGGATGKPKGILRPKSGHVFKLTL